MKFYLTGGTLRDKLLGHDSKTDFDFAVEAHSYEAMKDELLRRGMVVWQERPEFVTLRGRVPRASFGDFDGLLKKDADKHAFAGDFTLCRKETMYSDKRHPDKVTPADLDTDLARRDFTVNALAVSEDGTWHDPFGGTLDADALVLRTVGLASLRFTEDPLRMLRALRFANQYHMKFDADLVQSLEHWRTVVGLTTLPKERVMDELNKTFAHGWPHAMNLLFVQYPMLGAAVSTMNLKLKVTT